MKPKSLLCPSVFMPESHNEKTLHNWLDFLERDGQSVLLLGEIEGQVVKYRGSPPQILEIETLQNRPSETYQTLRIAASCQEKLCSNFDGQNCRVAANLASSAENKKRLPRCGIRARCRWWLQEGRAACQVCASFKTEVITAK